MPEMLAAVWVCDDCLFAREGDGTESPDREPWGLMREADVAGHWDGDTGEGIAEFSQSACDGCGSTLGGTRHRYAVFAWSRCRSCDGHGGHEVTGPRDEFLRWVPCPDCS
jgi:hypothetical protein